MLILCTISVVSDVIIRKPTHIFGSMFKTVVILMFISILILNFMIVHGAFVNYSIIIRI